MMKTTISSKGQIVLPAALRREDGIEAGQEFEIQRVDQGEYLLKRTERRRNEGLVQLLLDCPVKDWFKSVDRKETTEDVSVPKIG
jgi:AbrB family looped-hinge helix DNA binding protein